MEEFTPLNKQGARSREGFEVQFKGRFELEYREGGETVRMYAPPAEIDGAFSVVVDSTVFAEWGPGNPSPPELTRLFGNLSRALEFLGVNLVVSDEVYSAADLVAKFPNSKLAQRS